MADELTVLAGVRDNDSGRVYGGTAYNVDRTAEERCDNIQNIGITEEALSIAPLTTVAGCLAFFHNKDDTNYVEIRSATGASNDILKLKPGEKFSWRFGSDVSAPYAIANTAAVDLEFQIWKDS